MLVRSVHEHARLQHERGSRSVREVTLCEAAEHRLVFRVRGAIRIVRIDRLAKVVELSKLEAGDVMDGKAVEAALLHVQDENREDLGGKELWARGLEPRKNLAFWNGKLLERQDEIAGPGAGTDHEAVRLLGTGLGLDLHPIPRRAPGQDALPEAQGRAVSQRNVDVGQDRALREQEPAVRLKDDTRLRWEAAVRWKTLLEVERVEDLVWQVMLLRRSQSAAERRSIFRAALQASRCDQEPLLNVGFQGVPQLVCPSQERHIGGIFVIGEPDDASQAVRGTSLMQQIELLEAQDSPPPPREVRGGCTPHPSQPDDDRVVAHPVIMANRVNASMHTDG